MATSSCLQLPHLLVFWTHPRMVNPPSPWAACSKAPPYFKDILPNCVHHITFTISGSPSCWSTVPELPSCYLYLKSNFHFFSISKIDITPNMYRFGKKPKTKPVPTDIITLLLQDPHLWSPLLHGESEGGQLKAELFELGCDFGCPPWWVLVHEFHMKESTKNYNPQHLQIFQPIKMN